ncbi:MAG: hypothetical protein Q7R52_01850 [archaeon]|nr:hypothetical protein [archaeon]
MVEEFRQLSDEERDFCKLQKQSWFEKREDFQSELEFLDWQIAKGLPMNFKKQMKKFQADKRSIVEAIYESDMHLLTLEEQLTKGVLKKEQKDEEVKITLTREEVEE